MINAARSCLLQHVAGAVVDGEIDLDIASAVFRTERRVQFRFVYQGHEDVCADGIFIEVQQRGMGKMAFSYATVGRISSSKINVHCQGSQPS